MGESKGGSDQGVGAVGTRRESMPRIGVGSEHWMVRIEEGREEEVSAAPSHRPGYPHL